MKRLIFIAIMLVFVASCTKKGVKYSLIEKNLIERDSLIDVNATFYEIKSSNPKYKVWIDSINSVVYSDIFNTIDTIKKYSFKDRYFIGEKLPAYVLYLSDTVCFKSHYLLSILSTRYTYLGGAHGITNFVSYNYDLVKKKELTIENLFNQADTTQINALLEKYMHNPDKCFTKKPTLNDVAAFNFEGESMSFTYEQYVLGAYACGFLTIKVPIKEIKPYMLNVPNLSVGNIPIEGEKEDAL